MKKSDLKPPQGLSRQASAWWRRLQAEYAVRDSAGLLLLETAMRAYDRSRECAEQIGKEGRTIADRFEQPKPHPLLAAERDARGQMLAALKALNFDIEPLRDRPGRPAEGFGWKGGGK